MPGRFLAPFFTEATNTLFSPHTPCLPIQLSEAGGLDTLHQDCAMQFGEWVLSEEYVSSDAYSGGCSMPCLLRIG